MMMNKTFKLGTNTYLLRGKPSLIWPTLLSLLFIIPSLLFAEGTRTISPSATSLTALSLQPSYLSGSYLACPTDNRIRFHIKDYTTEKLYYGFNWMSYYALNGAPLSNIYIKLYDPSGKLVSKATKLNSSGAGFITTYQSAMAGPKIGSVNANGYTPSVFTPKMNGVYSIEIYQSSDGGLNQDNPTSSTTWSKSPYFDLTVATNAGVEKNGRVYCKKWSFTAVDPTTFQSTLSATSEAVVYPYTNDSLIYKLTFRKGFQPGDFSLALNNYGVSQGNNWLNDRKSVNSAINSDLPNGYSVFLNSPDLSLYPALTKLPLSPTFANPAIIGCSPGPYKLRFNVGLSGDCVLFFDLNGVVGYQANSSDRILEFPDCKPGLNVVSWDGRDGLGAVVPSGKNVEISITYKKGRTNLPLYDAEINKNGFSVDAILPLSNPNIKLFWDDSALTPIGATLNDSTNNLTLAGINNALSGSSSPAHAWNGDGNASKTIPAPSISSNDNDLYEASDFGNARILNTWFYGLELTAKLSTQINCVSVSGKVWNDVNNSANNSFNNIASTGEVGANAGLYASIIDPVTNTVIAIAPVNANGTFKISGCPVNGDNLPIVLSSVAGSVGSVAPQPALPQGWSNTSPLSNLIKTSTADITSIDFGIQQKPTAFDVDVPQVAKPGGKTLLTLANDLFDGLDPDGGTIVAVKITQFPTNIASLVVNGVTYTSTTFPSAGVSIPTNSLGQTVQTIAIDPIGGWNDVVQLVYQVVDNALAVSENEAISTLYFTPDADLKVTKSIDKFYATVGDTVKFTINAINNGPHDAAVVKAVDLLKAGYSFISSSTPNYNKTTGEWNIGNLAKGANLTMDIVAKVNPTGEYSNTVTITSLQTDTLIANNSFTINPLPKYLADLSVAKSINNSTPKVGEQVIFTLTAKNSGPNDATGVKLVDNLPSGYSYVSSSNGGVYNSTSGTVTWPSFNLANQATIAYTVTCTVKPTGIYANTATITGNEADKVLTNNSDTKTPVVSKVTDLQITKSANASSYNAGDPVAFTIVVKNNGPSVATNVVVTDSLPSGYTFVSTTGGIYNATTRKITWNLSSLASTSSATYVVNCTANQTGNYENVAKVYGAELDANLTNNIAKSTPLITVLTDLSIVKSASPSTLSVGNLVSFSLTAKNNSLSKATGVVITDSLPSGYTFLAASGATFNSATRKITWSNLSIEPMSSTTVTAICTVKGVGNYTNVAKISGAEKDPNLLNNSSSATPTVTPITDLSVTKVASSLTPTFGSQVSFVLTAKNIGPSNASNVKIADVLPSGLTFISATTFNGAYLNGVWTVGALNVGSTDILTMVCKVNSTGDYTNTATISGAETDKVTTNNSSSVTLTPVVAPFITDLSVTKSASTLAPVFGNQVSFTLTAKNNGPDVASGVSVVDHLPTGLTFVSATPSVGTFANGVWTIGAMNLNASATLNMVCVVNATGNYTNTATISGKEQDNVVTNNSAAVTLVPVTAPIVSDLMIQKTVSNLTPTFGDLVTFTLTAKNSGPMNATGVKVTDNLPTGLTFVSATTSIGTYSGGTWDLGNLATNASASLTMVCKVNATGSYLNTATIAGVEKDNDLTNNSQSVTLQPVPSASSADLLIKKSVSTTTPTISDLITYTITATNNGPANATNVKVAENIPSGLTYVAATPTVGTFAGGVWNIGNMTSGSSASMTIICKVNPTGDYVNTVTITGTETDYDLSNNSASVTLNPVTASLSADLSVDKKVDNGFPLIGDEVKFTITATNIGPNAATNVVVSDKIPSGYTFKSYNATKSVYTNGNWNIGSMIKGETAKLEVICVVNEAGDYTNTASISANETDANLQNNSSSVTPFVDHKPIAVADFFTPSKNKPYEGNVALNDKPSLDGGNVWKLLTVPVHGVIDFHADGTFTYTPETNYFGPDIFLYSLSDMNADKADAEVAIQVERVVVVPEGFSPNGDNVNDQLVIEGIEDYPANRLVVMNRWGNKVFEMKGYDNKWNGESNVGMMGSSNALPVGTYYFILDLNNGKKPMKGSIFLNR